MSAMSELDIDQQERLEVLEARLGAFLCGVDELTSNELAEYLHLIELRGEQHE